MIYWKGMLINNESPDYRAGFEHGYAKGHRDAVLMDPCSPSPILPAPAETNTAGSITSPSPDDDYLADLRSRKTKGFHKREPRPAPQPGEGPHG